MPVAREQLNGTERHFAGREGRISTRLTMVRAGIRKTIDTASATSSEAIIQLVSAGRGFPGVPENSGLTLPGMMELTRTVSWGGSSISAPVKPVRPNVDALYPAPPLKALRPAKLEILTMNPPPRVAKRASASCAQ